MPGDIGYYTVPVILSMDGVSKQVNSSLGKVFQGVGKKAGKDVSSGLKSTEADLKKASDAYTKFQDKASDALGKVRTEESKLAKLREQGTGGPQLVAAEERLATARRNSARAITDARRGAARGGRRRRQSARQARRARRYRHQSRPGDCRRGYRCRDGRDRRHRGARSRGRCRGERTLRPRCHV
jgi:hypothetical protein